MTTILCRIFCIGLLLCSTKARAAGPSEASKWLRQTQATAGSWNASSNSAKAFTTTAAAVEALAIEGQSTSTVAKALTYLQQQKRQDTDSLARRILAFARAKRQPSQRDYMALLALQRQDGGFAPLPGRTSSVLDTALALQALQVSQSLRISVAQRALLYLLAKQRKNGAWGFFDNNNQDSPYLSGMVLLAITPYQRVYNLRTAIQMGISYLTKAQAKNGSFPQGGEPLLNSALGALALHQATSAPQQAVQRAIVWLRTQQATNGSFAAQDAFSTAYVLRALLLPAADLTIRASDIKVSPVRPALASKVTFTITVRNAGIQDAGAFTLSLYQGDPNKGGKRIAQQTSPGVKAGQSAQLKVVWPKAGPSGRSLLYFRVDSADQVKESNERNNDALLVLPISTLDLAVFARSIVISPLFPVPGQKVEFRATILNLGDKTTSNVAVGFYDGNPAHGGRLFAPLQTIPTIPAGDSVTVRATTTAPLSQKNYTLHVLIDPQNTYQEQERSNNLALKPFVVKPRVDLSTNTQAISVSNETPTEGESVQIRVGVYNASATVAKDVVVRIYDGDPRNKGQQIGQDLKVTVPGHQALYTTAITYVTSGKVGRRAIYAMIDPDAKQPDIRPDNNTALRTIHIIGLPDYHIDNAQVSYNPQSVREGTQQRITFRVTNIGPTNATTQTRFHIYDTDPTKPGAKPIRDLLLAPINARSSQNLIMTWETDGKQGTQHFWALVDSTKLLKEHDETNNQVKISVQVAAPTVPDLSITESDWTITPTKPQAGQRLTFRVRVRNLLAKEARQVDVTLYREGLSTTHQIASTTITRIAGSQSALATLTWTDIADRDQMTFYIRIDPQNKIKERNESNNQSSRTVRFMLPASATPTQFRVTSSGNESLRFSWQPGPAAAASGIRGYRIYCNGGLMNPPTWLNRSTVTANSVFSSNSTYKASNANDGRYSSLWYPARTSRTTPPTLTFTFSKATQLSGLLIYFPSPQTRDYSAEAKINGTWRPLYRRKDGGYYQEAYFAPITTTQVRFVFAPGYRDYRALGIREVRWFQPNLATGPSHTISGLSATPYNCYIVGEQTLRQHTARSNEDSAILGRPSPLTPPAAPKVAYSTTTYSVGLSWNKATHPDHVGYRIYSNQGVNVAHWGRGATIQAIEAGAHYLTSRLLDGQTNTTASFTPPGYYQITLAKAYTLTRFSVHLPPNSAHAYRIEYSTDGQNYRRAFHTQAHQGTKEYVLQSPVKARYLRLVSEAPKGTRVYFSRFTAHTSEYAPLLPHKLLFLNSHNLGVHDGGRSYWDRGWISLYRTNNLLLRRFIYDRVGLRPFESITTREESSSRVLDRVSGNHTFRRSPWLLSRAMRFTYTPHRTKRMDGFRVLAALSYQRQNTLTYTQTKQYKNQTLGYALTSVDKYGNESALSAKTSVTIKDTLAPPAPLNLSAKGGASQVQLSWRVTRPPPDLQGFLVYRDGKQITTLPSTARKYTDMKVVNGQSYRYTISAFDVNRNESTKSSPAIATPSAMDLSITQQGSFSDLFVVPRSPNVTSPAILTALVRNLGQQEIPAGFQANFYQGDPTKGGTLIGTASAKATLPAGNTTILSLTWSLRSIKPGQYTIYVVLDPKGQLPELNETNNTASRTVTIHASPYLQTNINRIDATSFPRICSDLRVRDGSGGGIFGLNEGHFSVAEDKIHQQPLQVTQLTQNQKGLPKVDVVFVIDTSRSMEKEWRTVCAVLQNIRNLLLAARLDAQLTTYALGQFYQCGQALKKAVYNKAPTRAHGENWGPGSVWVVQQHTWRQGASRIVIPISDEGAYEGNPWSTSDTNSVTELITAANATTPQTHIFPFWGTEIGGVTSRDVVAQEMRRVARETKGKAFPFLNATQVVQEIVKAAQNTISDYRVCYTTKNAKRDGTQRKVDITTNYNVSKGSSTGVYRAPRNDRPDLRFVGIATHTPTQLASGQSATLRAAITNTGAIQATNILIQVRLKNVTLATYRLTSLAPNKTHQFSLPWLALPGISTLTFDIDPNNTIEESNESNNQLQHQIVLPGSLGVELTVASSDITLSKIPAQRGIPLRIQARIHNIGNKDASQVTVAFYDGDPGQQGQALGAVVLTKLPAQQSQNAALPYVPKRTGPLRLFVVIDPNNLIPEDLPNNNTATRSFVVAQKALLLSVSTDKQNYPAQSAVRITATLQNYDTRTWTGRGEVWLDDAKQQPLLKIADFQRKDLAIGGRRHWPAYIPINWTVPRGGSKDVFLGAKLNFTTALKNAGLSNVDFAPSSIRVALFSPTPGSNPLLLQDIGELPHKFQRDKGYHAKTKASGTLLFFLKATQAAGQKLQFRVFFDHSKGTPKPLSQLRFPQTGWQLIYGEDNGRLYLRQRQLNGSFAQERYITDLGGSSLTNRMTLLADFNEDGINDLIAASRDTGKLYLYPGRRAASPFDTKQRQEITTIAKTAPATGAVSGDFNKDGHLDFAFSVQSTLYIALGRGDGRFTVSSKAGSFGLGQGRAKALGDINNDGKSDLLVSTYNPAALYWLQGDGGGNFAQGKILFKTNTTNPYGLLYRDFTGNRYNDILLQEGSRGGRTLLYPRLHTTTFDIGRQLSSLRFPSVVTFAAGDWDYDGKIDIFTASHGIRRVQYHRGLGKLTFAPPVQLSRNAHNYLTLALGAPSAQVLLTPSPTVKPSPQILSFPWNTGKTHAGDYKIRVQLLEQSNKINEASTNIAIAPDIKVKVELKADRLAYPAQTLVRLTSRLHNQGTNHILRALQGSIQIANDKAKIVQTLNFAVRQLTPERFQDQLSAWNTGTHPPGQYTATLVLKTGQQELARSSVRFAITSSASNGLGLLGSLRVTPDLATPGTTLSLHYTLNNRSNQAFTDQRFVLLVLADNDRQEKGARTVKHTLGLQQSAQGQVQFSTQKLVEGAYTVLLTTNIGANDIALATARFTLRQVVTRPPLRIQLQSPNDNDILTNPVLMLTGEVSDGDARVEIGGVTAVVTGGSAQKSSFTLAQYNLNACQTTIQAVATREKEQATTSVRVAIETNVLVLEKTQDFGEDKAAGLILAKGNQGLLVFNTTTGTLTRVTYDEKTYKPLQRQDIAKNLRKTSAVLESPKGAIYIAQIDDDSVLRIERGKTTRILSRSDGLQKPSALAWGPQGELWIANRGNGQILKRDRQGKLSVYSDKFQEPIALVYDTRTGTLYVLDRKDGNLYGLQGPSQALPTQIASALTGQAAGLARIGSWLVASDKNKHLIAAVDLRSGSFQPIAGLLTQASSLVGVGQNNFFLTTDKRILRGRLRHLRCRADESTHEGSEADETPNDTSIATELNQGDAGDKTPEILVKESVAESSQTTEAPSNDRGVGAPGCGCSSFSSKNSAPVAYLLGLLFLLCLRRKQR